MEKQTKETGFWASLNILCFTFWLHSFPMVLYNLYIQVSGGPGSWSKNPSFPSPAWLPPWENDPKKEEAETWWPQTLLCAAASSSPLPFHVWRFNNDRNKGIWLVSIWNDKNGIASETQSMFRGQVLILSPAPLKKGNLQTTGVIVCLRAQGCRGSAVSGLSPSYLWLMGHEPWCRLVHWGPPASSRGGSACGGDLKLIESGLWIYICSKNCFYFE